MNHLNEAISEEIKELARNLIRDELRVEAIAIAGEVEVTIYLGEETVSEYSTTGLTD